MDSMEFSKLTPEKVMAMTDEEYLELVHWALANPFEAGIISKEAMSHLDPDGSTTAALFDEYEDQGVLYQNGERYLSDRHWEINRVNMQTAITAPTLTGNTSAPALDFEPAEFDTFITDVMTGKFDSVN